MKRKSNEKIKEKERKKNKELRYKFWFVRNMVCLGLPLPYASEYARTRIKVRAVHTFTFSLLNLMDALQKRNKNQQKQRFSRYCFFPWYLPFHSWLMSRDALSSCNMRAKNGKVTKGQIASQSTLQMEPAIRFIQQVVHDPEICSDA